MSIRLRLALWYGALFAVILLLVTVFSYAFHARGHYDDLDRALITAVSHTAEEAASSSSSPQLVEGSGGFRIILRIYSPTGQLLNSSLGATDVPARDPRTILQHPSGPAFDLVAGFAPPVTAPSPPSGSAFGLIATPAERWRVFVLPISQDEQASNADHLVGYVEGVVPLGDIDQSMQVFRLLLVGLSVFGLTIALVGSCLIAGSALRPVAQMIDTADGIAHSRDLSQRLGEPPYRDEIGRLARTFNAMLASIQASYDAQRRFVSDASHELRAPLTAIQANLELLQEHPDLPASEHAEALEEAARESSRLSRLVADLLALARADAGVPIRRFAVDLDVLVLDAFHLARELAHGLTVRLDLFEPMRVTGDEDRLKQVLVILIDNAIKYTPSGGTITLGLRNAGACAEVSVHDTGVGIAEDALPHVFERFYRADPARSRDPGGTGLGLAIARWIAEQHGGSIEITSQAGHGTTVTLRLPQSAVAGVDNARPVAVSHAD